jgi:cytochrome c553
MILRRVVLGVGMVVCAGAVPWMAHAADPVAGQAKAQTGCVACHGADGHSTLDPSYPKLAGQHRDYLEIALRDYQSGARKNAIMAAQAQALTREDIANLAAYFASLPGPLRIKP